MRQLWQTGWQHNRVRMVTASFLIKHLLIDWREGEKWFHDTLVDADPASNAASWQWVAGSGADASPYFRIFNPFTQGEKFDPNGDYIRKYIPELSKLPKKYIHRPWEAPDHILDQADVKLGETYPKPIVDHKATRLKRRRTLRLKSNAQSHSLTPFASLFFQLKHSGRPRIIIRIITRKILFAIKFTGKAAAVTTA